MNDTPKMRHISPPKSERAMSPEWVAMVTGPQAHEHIDDEDSPDPLWLRLVRDKEIERISWDHSSLLPG